MYETLNNPKVKYEESTISLSNIYLRRNRQIIKQVQLRK